MQGRPRSATPLVAIGAADADSLLGQLVEHAPMGIAVIDPEGFYTSANPAYCSIYGYTADELLGSSFTRVVPAPRRAQALARHRDFLRSVGTMDGEIDVVHRDGHTVHALLHSLAVPGADGQPHRLVYLLDISQRKQAEQALLAQQQFLQSVLDALTAHVCVLDEDGVVLAVNRAWREFGARNGGLQGDGVLGMNYLAVCDRASQLQAAADADGLPVARFADSLRSVLAGQRDGFQAEYACDTQQGRQWFVAHVSRTVGGPAPRTVVAHDNITALRQALHTLRDGEALQLDMAASIPGAMFRMELQAGARWCFTYMSPGIAALFGLTPAQVCGDVRALRRHILAEDLPAHDEVIRAAIAACQPFEQEYRIRSADGTLKWVHAKALPKLAGGTATVWTGMLQDVSERKHMEAVLRGSEERYRTLFETVAQGVVYQDAQGRIQSANPAAQRILGRSLAQMQAQHDGDPGWQAVREDGSPLPADAHPAIVALRTGMPVTDVVMGVPVVGRGTVWLLVNATPLARQGVVHEVYASFEDITERVLLSQELKLQASTDYLTGVANRRSLMQRLALEFERVKRPGSQHRCAVLAVDLDLFKQINDTHGHAAGDAVLQQVAALMQRLTRQLDLVARSGGEEFTLLLPDTGTDDALALAERLRSGLAAQPVQHQGRQLSVTVSVGVSEVLGADASLDAVLARADVALYAAKAGGRNQVRLAPRPA